MKKKEIIHYISKGNLEEAFSELKNSALTDSSLNEVILNESKWNLLKKDHLNGVISFDDYNLNLNKIIYSLLVLANSYAEVESKKEKSSRINLKTAIKSVKTKLESDKSLWLPSGFVQIDSLIAGFHESSLSLVVACPGNGKTSFCFSIVKNIAIDFEESTLVILNETTPEQFCMRLFSIVTPFLNTVRRDNQLKKLKDEDRKKANEIFDRHSDYSLHFSNNLTLGDIPKEIDFHIKENKIKFVYISGDFRKLSDTYTRNGNEVSENEILLILSKLKEISIKYNVAILIESLLPKDVLKNKIAYRPSFGDFSAIGINSFISLDSAFLIYRPQYYHVLKDKEGNSLEGLAEIMIKNKFREFPSSIWMSFNDQNASFEEIN